MPETVAVQIKKMKFDPKSVSIAAGDTVEWTNMDAPPHTVTDDNDEFKTNEPLSKGEKYSYTFATAGKRTYHCEIHPMMKGEVDVT